MKKPPSAPPSKFIHIRGHRAMSLFRLPIVPFSQLFGVGGGMHLRVRSTSCHACQDPASLLAKRETMREKARSRGRWYAGLRMEENHFVARFFDNLLVLESFLLASILAGCGGASSESQPLPPFQIAMYGDSTTAGWSWNGTSYVILAENEPAIVQSLLRATCPSVTVVNKGVVGASLDNLLAGTGGYTQPWTQEMADSPANIVVFNFGINDSHETDMTVQKFDAEVRETISIGQAVGKLMVIETSNPITQNSDALFPQLVADEQLVAQQLQVAIIDQFAYLSKLDWSSYLSDGVHPTAAGYALKANYTASILGPMLMSRGCF